MTWRGRRPEWVWLVTSIGLTPAWRMNTWTAGASGIGLGIDDSFPAGPLALGAASVTNCYAILPAYDSDYGTSTFQDFPNGVQKTLATTQVSFGPPPIEIGSHPIAAGMEARFSTWRGTSSWSSATRPAR